MSLFKWLSQVKATKPSQSAAVGSPAPAATPASAPDATPASGRRAERNERREQLYAIVRHAMSSAGVLSASYKFKVLSLDSRGASFLVMMDMVSGAAEDPERMSEIESLIASNAKNRFEIIVAAVYWRLSDYVAAGLTNRLAPPAKPAPPAAQPSLRQQRAQSAGARIAAPSTPAPAFRRPEPVGADEVLAFKNAFAMQGKGMPLSAPGEVQKSGRRSAAPVARPDFAETREADDRVSPLGPTQYGELN